MKIDYKFWYITTDNGFITEASVIFREVTVVPFKEELLEGNRSIVNKKIEKNKLKHLGKGKLKKMNDNTDTIVFNKEDFGELKNDKGYDGFDRLRAFVNSILIKQDLEAVDVQKETDVDKLTK